MQATAGADNAPVPNLPVAWRVVSSGPATAVLSGTTSLTDNRGLASMSGTTNTETGQYQVVATLPDGVHQVTLPIAQDNRNPANASRVVFNESAGPTVVSVVSPPWWAGLQENGWGMSAVQHDDRFFDVIFAYDEAGQPTWYVMSDGEWLSTRELYTGLLYSPHGTPYFAYDSSKFVVGEPIGFASVTPTGHDSATFLSNVSGKIWTKDIERDLSGPPRRIRPPRSGTCGGVARRKTAGASQCCSSTRSSSRCGTPTTRMAREGRLYRTTGTPWSAAVYDPNQFHATDVGAFRYRFSGDSATFDYSIGERSGTLSLTRTPF